MGLGGGTIVMDGRMHGDLIARRRMPRDAEW